MKAFQLAIFSLVLASFFTHEAFARGGATGVGGGGKGVVCRSTDGTIRSAELLDLWEAKKLYNRSIPESRQAAKDQAKEAILRLRNINSFLPSMTAIPNLRPEEKVAAGVWQRAQPFLDPNSPMIRRLRGVSLTDTDDSFELIRPQQPGCQLEQIVIYQDRTGQRPEIFVNQDIYEKMSATQQAALIMHEALYSYLRIGPDNDQGSVRTRRVVGYSFSGLTFPSLSKVLPKKHTTCYVDGPEVDDRVPFLFVFEGADAESFTVVRNYDLRPLPILGYFPAAADVAFNRGLEESVRREITKNIFSESLCDAPYMNDPNKIISGGVTIPGTGPADFDRTYSLSFACLAGGKRELRLVQGDIIEPNGTSKFRDLFCEESN